MYAQVISEIVEQGCDFYVIITAGCHHQHDDNWRRPRELMSDIRDPGKLGALN
jgi:hypothetical protein